MHRATSVRALVKEPSGSFSENCFLQLQVLPVMRCSHVCTVMAPSRVFPTTNDQQTCVFLAVCYVVCFIWWLWSLGWFHPMSLWLPGFCSSCLGGWLKRPGGMPRQGEVLVGIAQKTCLLTSFNHVHPIHGVFLGSFLSAWCRCPICRQAVAAVGKNHALDGLIEGLLKAICFQVAVLVNVLNLPWTLAIYENRGTSRKAANPGCFGWSWRPGSTTCPKHSWVRFIVGFTLPRDLHGWG